jgi:hypothetical protein
MRKLIIHIGHGKTGSSAIQAALAQNALKLATLGINYPYDISTEDAKLGRITSGNGLVLLDTKYNLDFSGQSLLYSSEILFHRLLDNPAARLSLISKAKSESYDLEFILYTRDLFEHSISAWGQHIKRGMGVLEYEDFVFSRYVVVKKLIKWMDLSKQEGFKLTTFNYERHKDCIVTHFMAEALGIGDSLRELEVDDLKPVNRSLSLSEYEIQRQFNIAFAPNNSNSFISDPLVEKAPFIKSEMPLVSFDSYQKIVNEFGKNIAKINKFINLENQIRITSHEDLVAISKDSEIDGYNLSALQIKVLAGSISNEISQLSAKVFEKCDIDILYDLALRIEKGEKLSIADSLALMRLVRRGDPTGPHISDKIEGYEVRVNRAAKRNQNFLSRARLTNLILSTVRKLFRG